LVGFSQLAQFGSYGIIFIAGAAILRSNMEHKPPLTDFVVTDFLYVLMSLMMAAMSMGQSSALGPDVAKAKVAAGKIFEAIDAVPTIDSQSDEGEVLKDVKGELVFTDVSFKYPTRPEVNVFENLTLKIKPGKVIAFVGASGCGKSTIVQLIERFYDPDSGYVTLDGHEIKKNLNLKWYRSLMSLVGQEPVLFSGTIADNIKFGKLDATDEEMYEAAKDANAYNFIMEFPNGFSTQVGEKGSKMSGGQKQRIAIARAMIRKPRILLLDEATSALDTKSEEVVQEALEKVMKGRTTIMIAHRLSTVINADKIVVFKSGKVVETGTHQKLMEKKENITNLQKKQVKEDPQPDQVEVNSKKKD